MKLGLAQGTSTTTYQVIDFINRGPVRCVLAGYPGVSLAGGTPAVPIGLPAAHTALMPAKLITLWPGGVANTLLQITDAHDYSKARCGPVQAQYLIISMPNEASPITVHYATTACAKPVQTLQVSGVAIGTGG